MKAKQIGITLALFATLVSAGAYAVSGWTPATTPTGVYAGYTDGSVYIEGLSNVAACTKSLVWFPTSSSDPAKILNIADAALLSGKHITCYVTGCDSSGVYQLGTKCKLSD